MEKDYYEFTHRSPEVKTLGQFLSKQTGIAYKQNPDEFLEFKGPNNETNLTSIFSMYTPTETSLNKSVPAQSLLLKVGTVLYIPKSKASTVGKLLDLSQVQVVSNDTTIFKAKELLKLQKDKGYVQVNTPDEGREDLTTLTKRSPGVTVWVWVRALSDPGDYSMQGKLIDVTDYIIDINTNVGANGGNFSFTLPPLVCERDQNDRWTIPQQNIQYFNYNGRRHYFSKAHIVKKRKGNLSKHLFFKRQNFLFHTLLSHNDMVFIRMETLKMEERQRYDDDLKKRILPQDLPGRIYDMIGFIDRNQISSTPGEASVSISISGRDCMKLLIDEGTYFFPSEFNKQTLGKLKPDSPFTLRNMDGRNLFFTIYHYNSIEDILKFVLNQLSSIRIVPDELFASYPKKNSFLESKNLIDNKKITEFDSAYQASRFHYDKALYYVKEARLTNQLTVDSPELEDSLCLQALSELINYVEQFKDSLTKDVGIQIPFTYKGTLFEDTQLVFRDDFTTLLPEPDISQIESGSVTRLVESELSAFIEVVNYVQSQNTSQEKRETVSKPMSGVWQLINLVIDQSVSERRVVDGSIASMQGSLLNFFQKVCQEPFVEFSGDTYGDQYFFTVRKPPFNASSLQGMLRGDYLTNPSPDVPLNSAIEAAPSIIIDIYDKNVLSESLSFNESDIYTWYHFTPKMSFLGGSDDFSLFYLPPIVLEELVEIYGNRPYQFIHNYLPYNKKLKNEDSKFISTIETQSFEDYKYVIESTAYLPFTRQGSLTIKLDRRIKRGDFIRFKPTGEIFYVEGVSHHYSISSSDLHEQTTLMVKRGMIEKFMTPQRVPGVSIPVSYFNIINTDLTYEFKTVKKETRRTTSKVKQTKNDGVVTKSNDSFSTPPSVVSQNRISKSYLSKLKRIEGFSSRRYEDSYRVNKDGSRTQLYSIGYGHQVSEVESKTYTASYVMSKEEGEKVLLKDVARRERIVNSCFQGLSQNQFDAIFDFVYNSCYSVEGFRKNYPRFIKLVSTYLSNPTQNNKTSLVKHWSSMAIKRGSKYEGGLRDRRREEITTFFKGVPVEIPEPLPTPVDSENEVPVIDSSEVEVYPETEEEEIISTEEEKVLDREKVFSKFKVNKDVLQFFQKKYQFD